MDPPGHQLYLLVSIRPRHTILFEKPYNFSTIAHVTQRFVRKSVQLPFCLASLRKFCTIFRTKYRSYCPFAKLLYEKPYNPPSIRYTATPALNFCTKIRTNNPPSASKRYFPKNCCQPIKPDRPHVDYNIRTRTGRMPIFQVGGQFSGQRIFFKAQFLATICYPERIKRINQISLHLERSTPLGIDSGAIGKSLWR